MRLSPTCPCPFSVQSSRDLRDLHSFPTRRSSDLTPNATGTVLFMFAQSSDRAHGEFLQVPRLVPPGVYLTNDMDRIRSEERRVGKECRAGWWRCGEKRKRGGVE